MKALTLQVLSGTFVMQIAICSQASQYREKCWNRNGDQGLSWCWTQRSGPPSRMLSSSPRLPECVSGGILKRTLEAVLSVHTAMMRLCQKRCLAMHKFLGCLGWQISRRNLQWKAIQQVRWIFAPLIFQVILLFRDISEHGGRNLWRLWSNLPLTAELSPTLDQGNHGFI